MRPGISQNVFCTVGDIAHPLGLPFCDVVHRLFIHTKKSTVYKPETTLTVPLKFVVR